MRVVALVSGGKDSCFNMMECVANGHDIIAIANLLPQSDDTDELDSHMYQTVGHHAIEAYAECMGVPLFRRRLQGGSTLHALQYTETEGDEVEDLYALLEDVKAAHPDVEGVASGAILSDYQRTRVEHVCGRLGLASLAFLWKRVQAPLLSAMVDSGVEAVLVKVAAMGLGSHHLGRTIADMQPHLLKLEAQYDCHVCGEGGEYETLTLDCPLFHKRLVLDETQTNVVSDDRYAPVAHLRILSFHVEEKDPDNVAQAQARMCEVLAEHRGVFTAGPSPDREAVDLPAPIDRDQTWTVCPETTEAEDEVAAAASVVVKDTCGFLHASGHVGTDIGAMMTELRDEHLQVDSMSHVLFTSILTDDLSQFGAINKVYGSFVAEDPPARATLELRMGGYADPAEAGALATGPPTMIELAGVTRARAEAAADYKSLHVQSISHWAPANIGPYAQAKCVHGLVRMAGNIGMVPATMALPESLWEECRQVLHNVCAVCDSVMRCGAPNPHLRYAIVWVTDMATVAPILQDLWHGFFALGPDHTPPVVLFATCPRLPRDAAAEVQVIAATQAAATHADVTCANTPTPAPGFPADIGAWHGATVSQSPYAAVTDAPLWRLSAAALLPTVDEVSAAAIVPAALAFLGHADHNPGDTAYVRIYAHLDISPAAVRAAWQALDTAWAAVPISVLPVADAMVWVPSPSPSPAPSPSPSPAVPACAIEVVSYIDI